MTPRRRRNSRGFTLVEMLVVIVIIALLASIALPAIFGAVVRAREAQILVEINQMKMALERYKNKYGDFPPNFNDANIVSLHVRKAFPRNTDAIPNGLSPDEALVFWLSGFSKDIRKPFTGPGGPVPAAPDGATEVLYEFKEERLVDLDGDGYMSYLPENGLGAPFVYFDRRSYAAITFSGAGQGGTARPYLSDLPDKTYADQDKYQIISAGLDGHYGNGGSFPSGAGYSVQDRDNITSLAPGKLGDQIEQ